MRVPRGITDESTDPNARVGLAWVITDLDGCNHSLYAKQGGVGSYRSYIAYTLEPTRRGVVLMFNYAISPPPTSALAAEILQTIP
jgi:hypothetical protein